MPRTHSGVRGRGDQPRIPSAPARGGSRGGRSPADASEGDCGPLPFSRTAERSSRSEAHCEAPGRQRRSGGPSGPAPPSGEGNGSRARGGSGCPGEVARVGRGCRRLERSPPVPTTSRPPSPKGGGDRGGGGAPGPGAPPGSSSGPGIRACSHVSGSAACTWASSGFPSGWATVCATDGRRQSYPNSGPGVKTMSCPARARIHPSPDRVGCHAGAEASRPGTVRHTTEHAPPGSARELSLTERGRLAVFQAGPDGPRDRRSPGVQGGARRRARAPSTTAAALSGPATVGWRAAPGRDPRWP